MIPVMEKEFTVNKKWITDEEMAEIVAVSEGTPGSMSVNAATFIGKRIGGFSGSFFATLGVVMPSFFIILILSLFIDVIKENAVVRYAFWGIRSGVLALIIKALILMGKQAPHNIFSYCLMGGAFAAEVFLNVNSMIIIASCGAIGVATALISKGKKDGRN